MTLCANAQVWDGEATPDITWENPVNWFGDVAPTTNGTSVVVIADFSSSGRVIDMTSDQDILRLEIGDAGNVNPVAELLGTNQTLTLRKTGIDDNAPAYWGNSSDGDPINIFPDIRLDAGVGTNSHFAHFREENNSHGGHHFYGRMMEAPGEDWTVYFNKRSARGEMHFYHPSNSVREFKVAAGNMYFHGNGSQGDAQLTTAGGAFRFQGDFYNQPLTNHVFFERNGTIRLENNLRIVGPVDQGIRTFTAMGNHLLRFEPATFTGTGPTIVRQGAFSISNMTNISTGTLELGDSDGVFVLGNNDVPSPSAFEAARTWNPGGGGGAWRLNGHGGFAARNVDIVLSNGWAGMTTATLDGDFLLGADIFLNSVLYADRSIEIQQDVVFSPRAANDFIRWTFRGNLISDGGNDFDNVWRLQEPIFTFSGDLSGGGLTTRIMTRGNGGNVATRNRGGIVRFTGDNTGLQLQDFYVGSDRHLVGNQPSDDRSGCVVIFSGTNTVPDAANIEVVAGGNSGRSRSLMLLDDPEGDGETYNFDFTVQQASQGSPGFGSYSGAVTHNGTITVQGGSANDQFSIHTESGTLTLEGAIARNDGNFKEVNKSGTGDVVFASSFLPNQNAGSGTWDIKVHEGTLFFDLNETLSTLTDVEVKIGGALGGTGAVVFASAGQEIDISGELVPGHDLGTFSVTGNVRMRSGSTYRWELGGSGGDLVDLSGDVILEDTWNLQLADFDGGGVVTSNDEYTVFYYGGTLTSSTSDDLVTSVNLDTSLVAANPRWDVSSVEVKFDASRVYLTGLTVESSPNPVDTDGDGMPDDAERIAGTDPLDPASFLWLHIERPTTPNLYLLSFQSVTGRTYAIEGINNLSDDTWSPVINGISGDGALKNVPNTNITGRTHYRLNVTQP
jgi:hypothetical protein